MVATALRSLLDAAADLDVVAVASSIAAGIAAVASTQPDVILTDLVLADGVVTDHLPRLRAASSASRVLLVTGAPTEKAVRDGLDGGVQGFLDKGCSFEELVDAVRRVATGELVTSPSLASMVLAQLRTPVGPHGRLTGRELDVLQQLARGRSTTAIAAELCLSAHTVRNHVARAMAKLGVHSRLEAVREAVRRGFVAPY